MSESVDLTGKVRTLSSRLKLEIVSDTVCKLYVYPIKGTTNKPTITIDIPNVYSKCNRLGIIRRIFFDVLFYKVDGLSLKKRFYILVALRAPLSERVLYTVRLDGKEFDILVNRDYLHISKHKSSSVLYGNYYSRFYKTHLERIMG